MSSFALGADAAPRVRGVPRCWIYCTAALWSRCGPAPGDGAGLRLRRLPPMRAFSQIGALSGHRGERILNQNEKLQLGNLAIGSKHCSCVSAGKRVAWGSTAVCEVAAGEFDRIARVRIVQGKRTPLAPRQGGKL